MAEIEENVHDGQGASAVTGKGPQPDAAAKDTNNAAPETGSQAGGDNDSDFSITNILGGEILRNPYVLKQMTFIGFVTLLCIIYTANRFQSQEDVQEIEALRTELQNIKYKVLTQSSELVNLTRQSTIVSTLRHTADSTIVMPELPPYYIKQEIPAEEDTLRED